MADLGPEEFSLTETLTALRTIDARVEKYSVSAFVFFSLSATVGLTGNEITLNGIKLTADVAMVMLFCVGVFSFVSRTLNFLGGEVYRLKFQELHQVVHGKKADLWAYSPSSTLSLYTVLNTIGKPGPTFKRAFALGFMLPMSVSIVNIYKIIDFSQASEFGFTEGVFGVSCLLLIMSYSLEFQVCLSDIAQKVKLSFDKAN